MSLWLRFPFNVSDEAYTAGVVFVCWIVHSVLFWSF
jgi:hypothetical protein